MTRCYNSASNLMKYLCSMVSRDMKSFQLSNTDVPMKGFTNIANTVSATQDEEVWVESLYYRDRQHMNEVMGKMQNDERMEPLMKQSFDLISSGTSFIMGEFDRLIV